MPRIYAPAILQQGEQVQLSSSDEDNGSDTKNSSSLPAYENFLTAPTLQSALAGKTGSELEVRLVSELSKGKNLIVELDRSDSDGLKSVALVTIDRIVASGGTKALLVLPSIQDVERLLGECEAIPAEIEALDKDVSSTREGALKVASGAPVLIASFDAAQSLDIKEKGIGVIALLGFSAGSKIPGSDDFEEFLTAAEGSQFIFCSESIPLTLNAAVSRHIKNDEAINVNLEKEQEVQLSHEYYEVGHELLAKPEALATVLETEGTLRAIVFCNSPSDTDLLEVLLKKKGLKAKKLIGNVPDRAIHSTMDRVRDGEIDILILTDISGRGFPVEEFDVIVHYAAPEDPEIYLHRLGQPDGKSRLKRVISLVGSMDLGNFHFLRKVVEFDFQARTLPSAEDIAKARFERLEHEAADFSSQDGELLEYARLIEQSSKRKEFILFLLHQALRKLPEAESSSGKGNRDRGGKRGRDRDESFEDREDRSSRSNQRNSREREERPKPRPTRKDIRFYVGQGLKNGLSEEKFTALVKEVMGDEAPELKRSCLRDKYSFFDFEQKVADEVFDAMRDAEYEGSSLVLQKAAILSVPLDEEEGEEEEGTTSSQEQIDDEPTTEDGEE